MAEIAVGDKVLLRTESIGEVIAINPDAKDEYVVRWGRTDDYIYFYSASDLLIVPDEADEEDGPVPSSIQEESAAWLVNLLKRQGYGKAFARGLLFELEVPEYIVERHT